MNVSYPQPHGLYSVLLPLLNPSYTTSLHWSIISFNRSHDLPVLRTREIEKEIEGKKIKEPCSILDLLITLPSSKKTTITIKCVPEDSEAILNFVSHALNPHLSPKQLSELRPADQKARASLIEILETRAREHEEYLAAKHQKKVQWKKGATTELMIEELPHIRRLSE